MYFKSSVDLSITVYEHYTMGSTFIESTADVNINKIIIVVRLNLYSRKKSHRNVNLSEESKSPAARYPMA